MPLAAHGAQMSARDYALRLTLSLVIATEAALLTLLILLNGKFVPHFSAGILVATVALVVAAHSRTQLPRMIALGALALLIELASLPSSPSSPSIHDKAITLLAGLHAAHVLAGIILATWTLALPRWRRPQLARLTGTYWYFVALAWLVVGPLTH